MASSSFLFGGNVNPEPLLSSFLQSPAQSTPLSSDRKKLSIIAVSKWAIAPFNRPQRSLNTTASPGAPPAFFRHQPNYQENTLPFYQGVCVTGEGVEVAGGDVSVKGGAGAGVGNTGCTGEAGLLGLGTGNVSNVAG